MLQSGRELFQLLRDAAWQLANEGAARDGARQLDDQHPVLPLSIDLDQDVGVAALLGWSEQQSGLEPGLWTAELELWRGGWHPFGLGGGLHPESYPLADREPASGRQHIRLWSGPSPISGTRAERSPSWRSAAIKVSAEVDTVRVGDRLISVPFHGYVAIAVRRGQPATVTALADGRQVDSINLGRGASELYGNMRRRGPDRWPFARPVSVTTPDHMT
jgi:hypothetical protein